MPRIPPVTRDRVPEEYLAGFDQETAFEADPRKDPDNPELPD